MAKVGDHILIIEMKDEPSYNGKEGEVLFIDDIGQIHGTWGGCALIPEVDKFEVIRSSLRINSIESINKHSKTGAFYFFTQYKVFSKGKMSIFEKKEKLSMIEKVNKFHPDKLADRIAGALVDLAYKAERAPKIAVEVLIGHGCCHIICETSVHLKKKDVKNAVYRIAGRIAVDYVLSHQNKLLNEWTDIHGKTVLPDYFKKRPLGSR